MRLVINSKFRPFTYDELVKPLMQYKEAYDKVEADYSDLATQTEQWKDVVNQTENPKAYALYSNYANDLNTVIDDFSKGMTLQNSSKRLGLKKRYAAEIGAIARADAEVKKAEELRLKAGPDGLFQKNTFNLDDALHGKKINNSYQSREALMKKTAAMIEARMNTALKDPEFIKVMGDQYWKIVQHTGGSYEDLKVALASNPISQNMFTEVKEQLKKDLGYENYDTIGKQNINEAINTGLYAGLDKPTINYQANQNFQSDYQKAQLRLAKKQDTRAEKQLELQGIASGYRYNNSTKTWERDVTINAPMQQDANGNVVVPSTNELEQQGYTKEKDSNGKETGRMVRRNAKGKIEVIEKTANGWINSNQKDPDTYIARKQREEYNAVSTYLKDNKDLIAPYYWRAWSAKGGAGYENYGNNDPNFSDWDANSTFTEDKQEKRLSLSPGGNIVKKSANKAREQIIMFAGLTNATTPISEGTINTVSDKFFKFWRDKDWFSNNHFKMEFVDEKGNPMEHDKDAKGNELPTYKQTEAFKKRYIELRKALTEEPSSATTK